MALLYADEDFHYDVVIRVRQRGHDVQTVQEAGRAGGSDGQVLADATANGRAVLTFKRRDFRKLYRQTPYHAGIISCSRDDDLDALADRIDKAIAAAGSVAGRHIRVNRPTKP